MVRDRLPLLFELSGHPETDQQETIAQLQEKIGELTVEVDWLKKSANNWGCGRPKTTISILSRIGAARFSFFGHFFAQGRPNRFLGVKLTLVSGEVGRVAQGGQGQSQAPDRNQGRRLLAEHGRQSLLGPARFNPA